VRLWLPTLDEVVAIHAALIASHGGLPGIKDLGRLEAAVACPRASFGGSDLYPDEIAKANALAFALIAGHAFHDGNKRVGIACLALVLERNGWSLLATDAALEAFALAVASGQLDRAGAEDRIRPGCRLRLE